jgi:tetratricopeptide (TPR) repeat protein
VVQIVRAELDIGVLQPISWIELRSWRGDGRTETVLLRPREGRQLWPGEEVLVRVRWGYWAIPWVMGIERDDAGYFRRIVEHVPTAARAWKELATEYLYADEWDKLPATVARYLALVPRDVAFAGGVAAAMGVVQRPKLVRAVLEPALAGPFDYRVFALAGMAYHLTGDSARGLELLERARQADPANYLAYQGLGMVHENQGRLVEAVAMYETALARNPNLPYVAAGLPKLRHRAGLPPVGANSVRGSASRPADSSTGPTE